MNGNACMDIPNLADLLSQVCSIVLFMRTIICTYHFMAICVPWQLHDGHTIMESHHQRWMPSCPSVQEVEVIISWSSHPACDILPPAASNKVLKCKPSTHTDISCLQSSEGHHIKVNVLDLSDYEVNKSPIDLVGQYSLTSEILHDHAH